MSEDSSCPRHGWTGCVCSRAPDYRVRTPDLVTDPVPGGPQAEPEPEAHRDEHEINR
jgi:hypothetical protein